METPLAVAEFDGMITVQRGHLSNWQDVTRFVRSIEKQAVRAFGPHPNKLGRIRNAKDLCDRGTG